MSAENGGAACGGFGCIFTWTWAAVNTSATSCLSQCWANHLRGRHDVRPKSQRRPQEGRVGQSQQSGAWPQEGWRRPSTGGQSDTESQSEVQMVWLKIWCYFHLLPRALLFNHLESQLLLLQMRVIIRLRTEETAVRMCAGSGCVLSNAPFPFHFRFAPSLSAQWRIWPRWEWSDKDQFSFFSCYSKFPKSKLVPFSGNNIKYVFTMCE